jgi:hypothetical protein
MPDYIETGLRKRVSSWFGNPPYISLLWKRHSAIDFEYDPELRNVYSDEDGSLDYPGVADRAINSGHLKDTLAILCLKLNMDDSEVHEVIKQVEITLLIL